MPSAAELRALGQYVGGPQPGRGRQLIDMLSRFPASLGNAWEGMTNQMAREGDAMIATAMHPGEVYAGRADAGDIAASTDLAGMAMMGGLAGTGPGGVAVGSGPVRRQALPMDEASRMARATEQGFQGPWYHGTSRADRMLEMDPKRATSGPMPFFTDNPVMASNYASGKADTSLARGDTGNVADYFTVNAKDLWGSGRSSVPVERSWHSLPPEVKADIAAKAKRIGYEDPEQAIGPLTLHEAEASIAPSSHYDYLLNREHKGNHLAALRDIWHDSGELVDNPGALADVYRLAGYPHKISDVNAPWVEAQGVVPAMLKMERPLDTTNADEMMKVANSLEQAFAKDRSRTKPEGEGVDMWDKSVRWTPKHWVHQLKTDLAEGKNSMVFTSIPDKVTAELRRLGYDGILDTGGKMGGEGHTVAIPFGPEQVRSKFAKFDPKNQGKGMLLGSGVGPGAAIPLMLEERQ